MNDFHKYLKYKNKYLKLKYQYGKGKKNILVFGSAPSTYISGKFDPKATFEKQTIVSDFRDNLRVSINEASRLGIKHYDTALWYGTQSLLNDLSADKLIYTKILLEPPIDTLDELIKNFDIQNKFCLEFEEQFLAIQEILQSSTNQEEIIVLKSKELIKKNLPKFTTPENKLECIYIHFPFETLDNVKIFELMLNKLDDITRFFGISNFILLKKYSEIEEILEIYDKWSDTKNISNKKFYIQENLSYGFDLILPYVEEIKKKFSNINIILVGFPGKMIKDECITYSDPSCDAIDMIIFKTLSEKRTEYIQEWIANYSL